jgi:isoquinoline 1-oxidoreductase subunit beta
MKKPKPDAATRWKTTRRRFLIGTGSLGVLAVGAYFGWQEARPALVDRFADASFGGTPPPPDPSIWFELKPDKTVFYAPKFEMGQGIQSALAQIAAEELEVDWRTLELRQPDAAHGFAAMTMFTFGSTSVNALYKPVREMAANLRIMLRDEAAKQMGVDPNSVVCKNGMCSSGTKTLSYGQVVAARQGQWVLPKTAPPLKNKSEFVSIGKPMPRLDAKDKVTGKPVYSMDARLEGMLYGAVARPPRIGAVLESAKAGSAESATGVVKVVLDVAANFAGVVAQTRTQAREALKLLELRWTGGTTISQPELERRITPRRGAGALIRKRGRGLTQDERLDASQLIVAEYKTPLAAHAHLEPLAALADVQEKEIRVWCGTQLTSSDERSVKAAVPGNRTVRVFPMQMGGSFGRKGSQSAAPEAARLSAAVGKPVHVAWTREEEMQHSFYRPPSHTLLQATLQDGKINVLEQLTASGDILFGIIPIPEFAKTFVGFDFGVMSGQFSPYDLTNYHVRSQRVPLPIPTGPWRGLGLMPNIFALESFMDELALAAKADPLEFRLKHTNNPRIRAVLEDVGQRSGWDNPAPDGTARGLAFGIHGKTLVGMVAEVRLSGQEILVERMTVTIDAGLIVSPTNAALQAKGSVVMGLSSTLLEKLTVENGAIVQSNFKEYPLLGLKATPKQIDVRFLESGDEPHGMGEPVIGPVAAAVANAVAALSGQRLRELPLRLA